MDKRTKIIATISDKRCEVEFIRSLYEAGMNAVRINTAHVTTRSAATIVENVRRVSEKIAIIIDTKGPEIRLTGMAAGFAGLFRTPIAATFFALEVLTAGVLEYSALLPALVASFTASACSGLLGLEKFTVALTDQVAFSAPLVGKLLLFGLLFGLVGGLFAFALHKLKALFA